MKWWLIILALVCNGCGGELILTPNGHRLLYKSKDGQISCYTDNCCYPYKEKLMACTQADADIGGLNTMSISIKYIPDK